MGTTKHHRPADLGDRFAFVLVKILRFVADAFFAKRYGHRAVVLETVAAAPGMVGGMLLHLKCLRRMIDDRGWIRVLLAEAENERMHLMTFIEIAQPKKLPNNASKPGLIGCLSLPKKASLPSSRLGQLVDQHSSGPSSGRSSGIVSATIAFLQSYPNKKAYWEIYARDSAEKLFSDYNVFSSLTVVLTIHPDDVRSYVRTATATLAELINGPVQIRIPSLWRTKMEMHWLGSPHTYTSRH
jgi:hypothetical protein